MRDDDRRAAERAFANGVAERSAWRGRDDTVLTLVLRASQLRLTAARMAQFSDDEWEYFKDQAGLLADAAMCAEVVTLLLQSELEVGRDDKP